MISIRKLIISILLGLGGLGFSLLSFRFDNPPFIITITWSYFLPLLAGLAFGPLYGLAAGLLGLGAFYPFLLYPDNGWANLVTSAIMTLWFTWMGFSEQIRRQKPDFWNRPLLAHLPFAIFYALSFSIFFPLAFSFNPPFWYPPAQRSMPPSLLQGIIAKETLVMYMVLIVDVGLLKITSVRRLFGLESQPESRRNGRVMLGAFACSFLLWVVQLVLYRIFIDQTFPQGLFQIREPHEVVALFVFLSAGFLVGSVLCIYIEQRLKTEAELKQSRENYRLIFEQAADGIFLVGPQGNYLDANESACRLTGYSRDELLRLNPIDLVVAEEKEALLVRFQQIIAGETLVFEGRMRHKSGAPIEVEVNARKLPDGRLQGLVRDIRQRRQTEEALKLNNELFTQFLLHSPVYTFIKEVSPNRSLVLRASENFSEMVGIPGSQMAGKDMFALFPPDFAAKMTADDWAVVSGAKVLRLEEELNGRCYTTIKFPILFGDKTFLAGYTIDISEQKKIEAQLLASQAELKGLLVDTEFSRQALLSLLEDQKEAEDQIRQLNAELELRVNERTAQLALANKELEAFAYSVSHDLRAPLRALEGFSAVLMEDYAASLDAQGQHYLNRIQEAARRMSQLINDLLNLSRVTRAELRIQKVDLSALARAISAELLAQAPARKVEVEIANDLLVSGDVNLLKIALENLLENAFKFTSPREQACIQVGALEGNEEPVFFVKDNGSGFNMEYATKLFAPFQRLHSASEFPGTGIGLSIVQRIVSRHGGRIWPESQPDRGATFFFTLPAPK